MKAFDNGSFYSCQCSTNDVRMFNSTWPCSVIPNRPMWFQWDKRNGDLVDMKPSDVDGPEVLALCEDAQKYAKKRLKLDMASA